MKVKVIKYEQHQDNLQIALKTIKYDLERQGLTFDDFTIYLSTYDINDKDKHPSDLVNKITKESHNYVISDKYLNHKKSKSAFTINNETKIYDFYGDNFPSSKTKTKEELI